MATEDNYFIISDRNYLIGIHMAALEEGSNRQRDPPKLKTGMTLSETTKTTSTFSAPNRSFSRIPINQSNMITINDIVRKGPDFLHHGKFLLCRSIMPADEGTFALGLVVDEPISHRCLAVKLFNFAGIIRPGTILAIMHPWFKFQESAIRVENPQHVYIFNGNDPLIRGLKWKAPLPKKSGVIEENPGDDQRRGNQYFVDKNYQQAMEAYTRAIEIQPENAILYSNRAVTYLRMEQSAKALQDTQIGLNLQPSNVKLLYRKAKALIQLKRYEEASVFLEEAAEEQEEAMKDKTFVDLVKASKRMVDESKTGNYDIMEMMEEAKRSKILDNHADYYASGKFEVQEIPGKGRGLVAKEEIKSGTLLMACKSFIFAGKSEEAVMIIEELENTIRVEQMSLLPLVRKACEKLLNNPELGDEFYKLYAGKELGWLETADHSNPVDIDRIAGIIRRNTFRAADVKFVREAGESEYGAGLWMVSSYLNHSCVDTNCFSFFIGDFKFIRALKDVHVGEELLVHYVIPKRPFEQRRQVLDRPFQMECSCRLCQFERNEPEEVRKRLNEIGKILDDIEETSRRCEVMVWDGNFLKQLLEEVKESRPNLQFNYLAYRIQKMEAEIYLKVSPAYSQKSLDELFSIWKGNGDLHTAMTYAVEAGRDFVSLGYEKRMEWIKMAKDLARILYGDERVVDLMKIEWLI